MQNLNKKIDRLTKSRAPKKRSSKKILIRVIAFLIIFTIATILPLRFIASAFKDVQLHSKAIASAYESQNFGQLQTEVTETKKSLEKANLTLNLLIWMKVIPIVGGYYGDVKSFTSAGVEELIAVETILKDLKPKEIEVGFLGSPRAGNDRVTQAVKMLEAAMPSLDKVEPNLKKASNSVKDIDTEKYPEEVRGIKLRSQLSSLKNFIIGADVAVRDNKEALKIAPKALGEPNAKNYLLLFQNDKEIRATGGFLTAFATLKMDRGQIETTGSDDIYRLDERLLATCQSKICPLTPPAPIVKYLPEVTGKPRSAWSMRDSNLSPDLPTSARDFERMYQLLGSGLPFDGIVYIDTQVVEELIEVTGPIEVFGTPFSAEKDKRCNCPNVIYELEGYAEIASKGQQDRKAILGVMMQQMLVKVLNSDAEKIPQFMETVVRLANHKHILFYMHDKDVQAAVSGLNWTGEIKDYDGDYLHINDSNFAGGKSNLYVEQKVTQDISVKNGEVRKKITIDYKNPQKFDTWLNGINRDYVRIYVPKGAKLISSKGSEEKVTVIEDELGKTVIEAFVQVRPQNSRKLEIEYSFPYDPKGEYKILVQKQPGAKDFDYVIKINGSTKTTFDLDTDKEFKFKI